MCKNRTNRHRACHDTCAIYKAEKVQAEQRKQAISKAKEEQQFNYIAKHRGLSRYGKGNFISTMRGTI